MYGVVRGDNLCSKEGAVRREPLRTIRWQSPLGSVMFRHLNSPGELCITTPKNQSCSESDYIIPSFVISASSYLVNRRSSGIWPFTNSCRNKWYKIFCPRSPGHSLQEFCGPLPNIPQPLTYYKYSETKFTTGRPLLTHNT